MRVLVSAPGKRIMTREIFEHTAARKPVLTISDEGAARELVCKTGIGSVADPSDIEGLANELVKLTLTISNGSFLYPGITELLRQYDRRCIAGRLAPVLDRKVAHQ